MITRALRFAVNLEWLFRESESLPMIESVDDELHIKQQFKSIQWVD